MLLIWPIHVKETDKLIKIMSLRVLDVLTYHGLHADEGPP